MYNTTPHVKTDTATATAIYCAQLKDHISYSKLYVFTFGSNCENVDILVQSVTQTWAWDQNPPITSFTAR